MTLEIVFALIILLSLAIDVWFFFYCERQLREMHEELERTAD